MKSLIPLVFLVFTFNSMGTVQAQSLRSPTRYSVQAQVAASPYCTQERFESYVRLASAMRDYVTPQEYARLYIPLKVAASKAMITLKNYGPLSASTHAALFNIVKFVDANQNSFDALWEVEAFYYVATDLMDFTQALSRDLQ